MRLVLDTSTIVAAMRSPAGVSAHLLRRARLKQISLLANIALALEYEAAADPKTAVPKYVKELRKLIG